MYLRECYIENVGPIDKLDISLSLNDSGNPKPIILVGKNGTGKTIFLAYVLDALAELAKKKFSDIAIGQRVGSSPYLKVISSGDIRFLSGSSLSFLEFFNADNKFRYLEKMGEIDPQQYREELKNKLLQLWQNNEPFFKNVMGDEKQIETFFQTGAVCFFPSSRHERPHWLNDTAVEDRPLFRNHQKISGELGKPLIVERSAENNQQWLVDVLVDSLADLEVFLIRKTPGKISLNSSDF